MKKDCLWIRWVHSYYIKNQVVDSMPIPKNAAWVVRKIFGLRSLITELQHMQGDLTSRLTQMQTLGVRFSIKKLYQLLSPQFQRVPWKSLIMQSHLHPRFKFNLWLAAHGRLPTVDRLQKIEIQVPQTCVFCGLADELFEHLFFDCPYAKGIWSRLLSWHGHPRQITTWQAEVQWVNICAKRKTGHWAIVSCVFGMMVYLIWRDRNKLRFQGGSSSPDRLCKEIAVHIHTRSSLFPN
ncbi:uncharacterized protein LOC132047673 [Lycium ferocissimum]|uniref:uncharacterized protein LOC132047673 n=1 Tax=Lycium ferocissimum TaxID=112874 RepID=UPI00281635E1|nr:uncharacterized protein LOC132047673 [Lycium ferocissimum]